MTHYHNFEPVGENPEAIIEICTECKKRLVTKKDKKGRIDNKVYLKEHIRDTAQPQGITSKIFKKYYGKKPR